MNRSKLSYLEISNKEHRVIAWAICLYVGLGFIAMLPGFLSLCGVSNGAFLSTSRHLVKDNISNIALGVISTGGLACAWELLRRKLAKFHAVLSYVILAIITLVILSLLKLVPDYTSGSVMQLNQPFGTSVWHRIGFISGYLLSFVQFFLGIALAIKTRARLRTFGLALFVCPIIISFLDVTYIYIYNGELQVGIAEKAILCIISFMEWVLRVLPIIFLGRTMKVNEQDKRREEGSRWK